METLVRGKVQGEHWQAYRAVLQIVPLQTGHAWFAQVVVVGKLFV